jgi:hypothetical protein
MASEPSAPPSQFIFIPQPSISRLTYESTANLRIKILADPDSVDQMGQIYVESADFYKCTVGAQHEFLVFHVRDRLCPERKTVLILDRVPHWEVETQPDLTDRKSLDLTLEDVQRQQSPETLS